MSDQTTFFLSERSEVKFIFAKQKLGQERTNYATPKLNAGIRFNHWQEKMVDGLIIDIDQYLQSHQPENYDFPLILDDLEATTA
jgi:hypothetical protein